MGHTIGLIGCGHWGQYILRDLLALGCKVSVVARSQESKQRAHQVGATEIVSSIDELPSIDGAVVAVLTVEHASVIEQLLPLNIPVFVEKTLTSDLQSAQRLVNLASDRIFVMDKWRYHPGVEMLADIARTEELGPVIGLQTKRIGWGNPHSDLDGVWILTPHDLSIALEILGEIPPPHSAIGECIDGESCSLTGILGTTPWFKCEISTRSPKRVREVCLHCRDGIACLEDGYSNHVQIVRGSIDRPPEIEARAISSEMPLLRELQAFISYLEGGPAPRSSAREGLQVIETLTQLCQMAGIEDRMAIHA